MEQSAVFLVVAGTIYGMVRGAGYTSLIHDIIVGSLLSVIGASAYLTRGENPLPSLGAAVLSAVAGYVIFLLLLKRPNGSKSATS